MQNRGATTARVFIDKNAPGSFTYSFNTVGTETIEKVLEYSPIQQGGFAALL